MNDSKYSFAKLRRHTEVIRQEATPLLDSHFANIDQAFPDFSNFLSGLDHVSDRLESNVKKMLACKFLNHAYSALILTECGLVVDAILCERNALETVAYYWLVCLDPQTPEDYYKNKIDRPVVVRQKLEKLGADISGLKALYSSGSEASHVGRLSENFHSAIESKTDVILFYGGAYAPTDQAEMLSFLPALFYLFMQPIMRNSK